MICGYVWSLLDKLGFMNINMATQIKDVCRLGGHYQMFPRLMSAQLKETVNKNIHNKKYIQVIFRIIVWGEFLWRNPPILYNILQKYGYSLSSFPGCDQTPHCGQEYKLQFVGPRRPNPPPTSSPGQARTRGMGWSDWGLSWSWALCSQGKSSITLLLEDERTFVWRCQ